MSPDLLVASQALVLLDSAVEVEHLFARPFADQHPLRVLDVLLAEEAGRAVLVHCGGQDGFFPAEPDLLVLGETTLGGRSVHILVAFVVSRVAGAGSVIFHSGVSGVLLRELASDSARIGGRGAFLGLPSDSEVAFATGSATVAAGKSCLEEVKLVVKGEFFVLFDVLKGEDTNADLVQDRPFSCLAVWVTRVVDEPGDVAGVGWVDDLVVLYPHQVGASGVLVPLDSLSADI